MKFLLSNLQISWFKELWSKTSHVSRKHQTAITCACWCICVFVDLSWRWLCRKMILVKLLSITFFFVPFVLTPSLPLARPSQTHHPLRVLLSVSLLCASHVLCASADVGVSAGKGVMWLVSVFVYCCATAKVQIKHNRFVDGLLNGTYRCMSSCPVGQCPHQSPCTGSSNLLCNFFLFNTIIKYKNMLDRSTFLLREDIIWMI